VVVDALGGNDTVNLSAATLEGAAIEGGEGDDVIVGSPAVDTIHGGPGNDRLTGFRGNETIEGQDGNDVMIWNNGDGKDVDEGGDGVDETLITTGAAADQMKVSPLAGARTFFERSNAPFTVDMGTVEKLSLTSFSGDDTLETLPGVTLPMTIDAGPGADTITTGAGTDRLVGDRGDDTLNAGAGDDRLVWNNGDGTDEMNGDDGLDRIEDNLGAAGDVSKVKVVGGKVRYDRVNAPFELDIASSEVLELNTFGGNDTLDVAPGVGSLIAITADGGSGDDRLNGGDEADTFFGGLGNDTLEPGAGADSVDGEAGDDTLRVRDGVGDLARGGPGTDTAQADPVDALADVEHADVPPRPSPGDVSTGMEPRHAPRARRRGRPRPRRSRHGQRSGGRRRRARRRRARRRPPAGRHPARRHPGHGAPGDLPPISSKPARGTFTVSVRVRCPAAEAGGCTGALSLLTAQPVRIGGVKVQALLGSKRYALTGGESRTLRIKLPRGVNRLARRGTLSLRAQSVSRDAAGNTATGSSKLSVKLVQKKKARR